MSEWPKELPPYQPGCAWNDWLHAIAEAMKENAMFATKVVPQFAPPKIEPPPTTKP